MRALQAKEDVIKHTLHKSQQFNQKDCLKSSNSPDACRLARLAMTSSMAGVKAEGVRSMLRNLALDAAFLEERKEEFN